MPELWVPWARCSVGLGVRGDSPLVFPVGVVTGIELGGKAHPVWCHLWSPVHIWPAVSGPAVCTSWGSPVLRQMLLLPLPSLQWTPIGVRRHQSFWEKHIQTCEQPLQLGPSSSEQESREQPDLLRSVGNRDHRDLLGLVRLEEAAPRASKPRQFAWHRVCLKCTQHWEMQITLQVYKKLRLNNNSRALPGTVF